METLISAPVTVEDVDHRQHKVKGTLKDEYTIIFTGDDLSITVKGNKESLSQFIMDQHVQVKIGIVQTKITPTEPEGPEK